MSTGVVLMATSTAQAAPDKKVHKSYVCKYVSTPGEGERLQTGRNPIWVDNHALLGKDGPTYVGQEFSDKHGRSVVIVANTKKLDPEPTVDDCPAPQPPPPLTPPGAPPTNDPCNPPGVTSNIAFVLPADTATLNWETGPNGSVTVAPQPGYVFSGNSQLITFTLPADSGVLCQGDQEIPVPAQPATTDPCNPPGVTSNIAFVVPADTAQLDWTLLQNGNVTVAPKSGFRFAGNSQLITFTLPADSGVLCVLGTEQIAPNVTFADPTCEKPNRTTWKGTFTDIVDYTVTGTPGRGKSITVNAAIKPDMADQYEFVDGAKTSFEHTFGTLKGLNCVKGTETVPPKPEDTPTVLGTQTGVPTAVAAGLGDSAPATSPIAVLAQILLVGGMLMLVAGGWIGLGRRETGTHEA